MNYVSHKNVKNNTSNVFYIAFLLDRDGGEIASLKNEVFIFTGVCKYEYILNDFKKENY